jgi:hypothetical protein
MEEEKADAIRCDSKCGPPFFVFVFPDNWKKTLTVPYLALATLH